MYVVCMHVCMHKQTCEALMDKQTCDALMDKQARDALMVKQACVGQAVAWHVAFV